MRTFKVKLQAREFLEGWTHGNKSWLLIIDAVRESQENAEKYVRYIVENRRSAGLPELVFEDGN